MKKHKVELSLCEIDLLKTLCYKESRLRFSPPTSYSEEFYIKRVERLSCALFEAYQEAFRCELEEHRNGK